MDQTRVQTADSAGAAERREQIRVEIELSIVIRTERGWWPATTVNIGEEGVLLRSDARLQLGEVYELALCLSDRDARATARVVHVGHDLYGLDFLSLPDGDRAYIRYLIALWTQITSARSAVPLPERALTEGGEPCPSTVQPPF